VNAPVITDGAGRQWKVYDFAVYAGKTQRYPLGKGQYRGFVPLDGGARRTYLMLQADRDRGTSDDVLLDQLAHAKLYHRDDPVKCAALGASPERVDPAGP